MTVGSAQAQVGTTPLDGTASTDGVASAARVASAEAAGTPLALESVTWTPSSRTHPTIHDLTLAIPAGQRVLLTGPSGGGKSTVLRALAGLLDTSTGDLEGTADGPTRPGERGLLLQQPLHALVGGSVGRDTAFGPENVGLARDRIQHRVTAALEAARTGLDASTSPWELSGGQQQRVALAGALALEPGALLLDEPLSMLDAPTASRVREAILDVVSARTLVVADHHVEHWEDHVDRVIVLGAGARVLADGAPHEVLADRESAPAASASGSPEHTVGSGSSERIVGSGAPVLELEGVAIARRAARSLPRDARTDRPPLLTGLDLSVAAGSLTALTGPSGSGKTTLLRTVLGLTDPAQGRIERPAAEHLALVPQEPEHSFVARSVREEVLASPWARDEQLADRLLTAAGLDHLQDAQPFELSGGEQRRLAVVAALAQEPELLVLDEPTVGLDRERREALFDLLDEARRGGCAVLAATHDRELIDRADGHIDLDAHRVQHAREDEAAAPDTTLRPARRTRPSPADALNPLTTIVIAGAAAVGSFAVDRWQTGLVLCALVAVLAPLAVRGLRRTALRLAPILLAAIGLCWSTVIASPLPALSGGAWLLGLKEALRITYFVAPGVLVFASLDPARLGDALGGRLRLPGRPVAASVAGLVRAGLTAEVWDRIITSRRLRGLGARRDLRHPLASTIALVRMLASCTLALLVDAVRTTEQQALAMDARGFATAQHRTWALPSPLTARDGVGLSLAALLLVAPWVLRALFGG
ncbi:energy-coupling factor ABC transporter ATP-binding protein [Brachybacterium endophyticum]|uniref:Energy-coupling factor ABC transporter ATP-binding protein n=1 Tax=Brachybacterium endophyticum TaxID=2182385 RepID=A0A2U2RLW2_9MICO|nr:ATP-binding cassette domain-containing protein [Brachybacterium endophyticum]PWH06863.1 energy-coupling factor ABC transporter ATP-binding protein [Brachybacterium endophyticum]